MECDDRTAPEAPAVKNPKKKLRKKLKADDEVIYTDPSSGERHAANVVAAVAGKGRYLIKLLSEEVELEAKASSLAKSDATDLQRQLDLEEAGSEDDETDEVAVSSKKSCTLENITAALVALICFCGVIIITSYHLGG
jgi:hypothetical protein